MSVTNSYLKPPRFSAAHFSARFTVTDGSELDWIRPVYMDPSMRQLRELATRLNHCHETALATLPDTMTLQCSYLPGDSRARHRESVTVFDTPQCNPSGRKAVGHFTREPFDWGHAARYESDTDFVNRMVCHLKRTQGVSS